MELEDYYPKIDILCNQFCKKHKNPRVEFEDLKQEACVKCLELLVLNKGEGYIFISMRNHLINYINKITKEIPIGLIGNDT